MRISRWFLVLTLLSSCAVEKKGILVDVEPGTPMDETDLRQHCDLGDRAACALSDNDDSRMPRPNLPVIQGIAPSDRATFTALEPAGSKLFWFIYDRDTNKLTKLFTVKTISRGGSAYALQRLDASGLLPAHRYELLAGDSDGKLIEIRKFHTFLNEEKHLRAEIITGWRMGSHETRLRLLEAVHARKPQLLILAGSVVDATLPPKLASLKGRASRDAYFERHVAARTSFELGFEHELLPVAVLWNDDEYGRPDAGEAFSQRDEAREMMELFFPHWSDETSIVDGPGISLTLDFRTIELALVDDLSFRRGPTGGGEVCRKAKGHKHEVCRTSKLIPAPAGTRYGSLLRDWITSRSNKAGRPLWLLTGGPHLVPYSPTWHENPEFDAISLSHPPQNAALWEISAERGLPATLTLLP